VVFCPLQSSYSTTLQRKRFGLGLTRSRCVCLSVCLSVYVCVCVRTCVCMQVNRLTLHAVHNHLRAEGVGAFGLTPTLNPAEAFAARVRL